MRQLTDHLPVHYRPVWADRFEIPADVCGFCSDFEAGRLVPVSFCPAAKQACEQWYAHVYHGAPEPEWCWLHGPDASSAVLE